MSDLSHDRTYDHTRAPGEEGYVTFAFAHPAHTFKALDEGAAEYLEDTGRDIERAYRRDWWTTHLRDWHGWDDDTIDAYLHDADFLLETDDDGNIVYAGGRLGGKSRSRLKTTRKHGFNRHHIEHGDDEDDDGEWVVKEPLPIPRPHTHEAKSAIRWVLANMSSFNPMPEHLQVAISALVDYIFDQEGG